MSSMIKVDQESRSFVAQRAIGSGFQSILFDDCRSVEDVRECVQIVLPDTPSDGGTYGVVTRCFSYVEYGGTPEYAQVLRDVVVVIMIEKQDTVEQLEEVLSVEGVDMVQWGPSDYSMGIGRPGEGSSPGIKATERKVFETAISMGISPRAEIGSVDQAKYYLDLGVRHFCIGIDISILHNCWETNGDDLRKAISSA